MRGLIVIFTGVLLASVLSAQRTKTPVYLAHRGVDKVGLEFVSALKARLRRSPDYELYTDVPPDGVFVFSLELVTLDVPDSGRGSDQRSAISVLIEYNSPGLNHPAEWYHKAFLIDRKRIDQMARTLLEDIDVSWCRTIKNAPNTCPKELIP
jgi:hypothetical protein